VPLSYLCIHNKLINLSANRNPAGGSHQSKQAPAENPGFLGWFSSWLPSAELAPVQAAKNPMQNPSKGMSHLDITQR